MPAEAHHRHFYLLQDQLEADDVNQMLNPIKFEDESRALKRLQSWTSDPLAQRSLAKALPYLFAALSQAAAPDRVLIHIERLSQHMASDAAWFDYLAEHPRTIETLVKLFSGSQFLTEILLRHPEYVYRFQDPRSLAKINSLDDFKSEMELLTSKLKNVDEALDQLRRQQRWDLLRIGLADLLGLVDLETVTHQLSLLAQCLIQYCLNLSAFDSGMDVDKFVVIALGKLGGGELNYSSDIDLFFLCDGQGSDYEPLGKRLINALSRITSEGFLYRVDMRLRPWGNSGPLVSSLEGYAKYFSESARLWEKQALLKASPVAGNLALGHQALEHVRPLIFSDDDVNVREAVREMKQRTEQHLKSSGRKWGEVKLGEGSIRDVEFIVQFLQLNHGKENPALLSTATLSGLKKLYEANFITQRDRRVLREGYTFLRTLEHHLQMMHHHQVHRLPSDPQKLTQLAQRLGFRQDDAEAQLRQRYQQHSQAIRTIYLQYLGEDETSESASTNATQAHLDRMHTSYANIFDPEEIEQHAALSQQLDRQTPIQINAVPQPDGSWQVTLVGFDYLGELSMICGLFTAHGLNILSGHVFTYEPQQDDAPVLEPASSSLGAKRHPSGEQSKIVDVFSVEPLDPSVAPNWGAYAQDLTDLVKLTRKGETRQAQSKLVSQVAEAVSRTSLGELQIYPVDIAIDNDTSKRYTVLHIDSPDTFGFLYELTNALALNNVYIGRMEVDAQGERAHDTLYVSDRQGKKIKSLKRQRELRTATVLVKHFTHLLPHSSNPASALVNFRQFMEKFLAQPRWMNELNSLEQPEVLVALARLLGISDFLWDDFLRMQYANLFPVLKDTKTLTKGKNKKQLAKSLNTEIHSVDKFDAAAEVLNQFKDREMFRIDMRHILGHIETFEGFSEELTDLAEVIVATAFELCLAHLNNTYGQPMLNDGRVCPYTICALGKCGGRELGFASDIELMFVYLDNGMTSGPHPISNTEFFEKTVELFVGTVKARREGIFEIDLQLRPYGGAGSMAVPWESFSQYFSPDGPAWPYERQALVRLRPIAGDGAFSDNLTTLRDQLIYTDIPFDVTAYRAMRERQLRHLVTAGTFNAKFSAGGLVDIEYLVQALQLTHGYEIAEARQPNTLAALDALEKHNILTDSQYQILIQAHRFFRQLINALRMVRGSAKDLTVPATDSEEFLFLARRLGDRDPAQLFSELNRHTELVRQLNDALLQ